MNNLLTFLRPPSFADEALTLRARALHTLLINMFLALFVVGILSVAFFFAEKAATAAILLAALSIIGLGLFLNHKGSTQVAARLIFAGFWLVTTLIVLLSQGTRSLNMMFFISGTVGVGLVMGVNSALIYALISLVATGVIAILSQTGLFVLPSLFPLPPLAGWILLVMNLAFTVIPLNIIHKTLANALDLARKEIGERKQAEEGLRTREAILEAVTFAAEQFLKSPDWRENIDQVLMRLGQSIHASHAYIFEHHLGPEGEEVSSLRYEWTASDQESDLDNPLYQNSPMQSEDYKRFFEVLGQGLPLASDRTRLSAHEAEFLHSRGILALLDVPIWVNGRWWGIIGFDDCVQDRVWQSVEIDALKIAANILSAAIEGQEADAALRISEERYRLISSVSSDYTFSTRLDEQGSLRVDWIAGAFERITGYSVAEFHELGEWATIVHPDDKGKDAQDMTQLYQNQRVVSEIRIVHKDGRVCWVRSYAHPVWNEEKNQLAGVYGAVQDITEQKQVEEALRISEEKFAKAFQASPDAITISTLSGDSKFVDVNEGFLRLSGYTREEVLNRRVQELNLWPDASEREEVVQLLSQNGRVVNKEIILSTKTGEPHNFLLSAERIEISGEPYAVFIARDITERKRIEEALKASEAKFAKAFRASPDALAIASVYNQRGILDVNEGFTRLTGYSREEVLNRTTADLNLWHSAQEQQRILEILRQNERIVSQEIILRHRSGRPIDCLFSAELIEIEGEVYAVTIFRDITERKQMEQALEQERRLLRTVIDTLPDYIYLKDTEFRCLVSNVANARVLGVQSPAEVEGKTLHDFYSPEEAEMYNLKDEIIMTSGEALLNEENSFIDRETGQRRWTWMTRIPFRATNGRILGVVGMSRDITAYKEALLEQERLIAELQAKNAELERFTYTVSHDLKSPLVTIAGFVGFLEKDAAAGDMNRLRQDIAKIQEAADQMKRLLDDLLELSRIGRLINPPVELSFAVVVREALNMISLQVAELGIEVVIPDDFPVVMGDRLRLVEVMQNLLENAVKFMGKQPQPRIEIGIREPAREGDEITFFVKDNGIGIDPQYHETIFGLFNRLNHTIEGTGVGLALVKRIIETHGGRVWVESMGKGQGTTICFTLAGEAAV